MQVMPGRHLLDGGLFLRRIARLYAPTIREITRQEKTEDVLNYQHKDIPNERPKCGSECILKPL